MPTEADQTETPDTVTDTPIAELTEDTQASAAVSETAPDAPAPTTAAPDATESTQASAAPSETTTADDTQAPAVVHDTIESTPAPAAAPDTADDTQAPAAISATTTADDTQAPAATPAPAAASEPAERPTPPVAAEPPRPNKSGRTFTDAERAARKERVAKAKDALARSVGMKGDHVTAARAALKVYLQRLNDPNQPDDARFEMLVEAPFRTPPKKRTNERRF